MKQIRRDIQAVDGPGTVKLVPEEAEDLWSVYNLVCAGDRVTAATVRKVQRETAAGAHRDAERVRLTLRLQVEAVDYDSAAAVLRVRGKNEMETEHVRVGAFHTLELDLQRPFTLAKDVWDSVALDALARACNPAASADLAVLLIQEGLANLLLVGASLTTARARVETSIARKRGPAIAGYERTLNRFFENVLQALLRHCDFGVVRCLVIAGPGFTKEQFHRFLLLEAERRALRQVIENKARIVLAPASSGYRHSLGEVLNAPAVMAMIKDTKAAQEVRALREFHEMMSNEPARACYGPKHVALAQEQLAVQSLLITDELFRNADLPSRKRYVDLVESVKNAGGAVHVFSSMHVSGEQLQQLSGIAAVLRFPMPELEDLEM